MQRSLNRATRALCTSRSHFLATCGPWSTIPGMYYCFTWQPASVSSVFSSTPNQSDVERASNLSRLCRRRSSKQQQKTTRRPSWHAQSQSRCKRRRPRRLLSLLAPQRQAPPPPTPPPPPRRPRPPHRIALAVMKMIRNCARRSHSRSAWLTSTVNAARWWERRRLITAGCHHEPRASKPSRPPRRRQRLQKNQSWMRTRCGRRD